MVSAGSTETMDVLREGIMAVAVGVSGSKPIPEDLVDPLVEVRSFFNKWCESTQTADEYK